MEVIIFQHLNDECPDERHTPPAFLITFPGNLALYHFTFYRGEPICSQTGYIFSETANSSKCPGLNALLYRVH